VGAALDYYRPGARLGLFPLFLSCQMGNGQLMADDNIC